MKPQREGESWKYSTISVVRNIKSYMKNICHIFHIRNIHIWNIHIHVSHTIQFTFLTFLTCLYKISQINKIHSFVYALIDWKSINCDYMNMYHLLLSINKLIFIFFIFRTCCGIVLLTKFENPQKQGIAKKNLSKALQDV